MLSILTRTARTFARATALVAFLTAGLVAGDAPAAGPAFGTGPKMLEAPAARTTTKAAPKTVRRHAGQLGGVSLGGFGGRLNAHCSGNICTCEGEADCEDMFDKDYLCIPGTEGVDETGTIRGWCRIR